jgi:hypothetical protein
MASTLPKGKSRAINGRKMNPELRWKQYTTCQEVESNMGLENGSEGSDE